ncbi:hypothetical protein RI367_008024 [Sorochytrium milnesiophthora]
MAIEPLQPAPLGEDSGDAKATAAAKRLKRDLAKLGSLEAALKRCSVVAAARTSSSSHHKTAPSAMASAALPSSSTSTAAKGGAPLSSGHHHHYPNTRTFAVYSLSVYRIANAHLYKLRDMSSQAYFKATLGISRAQIYRIVTAGTIIQHLVMDEELDLDDAARLARLPRSQAMCTLLSRLASGSPKRERMLWERAQKMHRQQHTAVGKMIGASVSASHLQQAWQALCETPEWKDAVASSAAALSEKMEQDDDITPTEDSNVQTDPNDGQQAASPLVIEASSVSQDMPLATPTPSQDDLWQAPPQHSYYPASPPQQYKHAAYGAPAPPPALLPPMDPYRCYAPYTVSNNVHPSMANAYPYPSLPPAYAPAAHYPAPAPSPYPYAAYAWPSYPQY